MIINILVFIIAFLLGLIVGDGGLIKKWQKNM